MIDMSRIPTSDMFNVRGMGVAVIVSTSTRLRICLMRSLCATPKRCSSSTTRRPRSLNRTSFDKQPMRADDDVDSARRQPLEHFFGLLLRAKAADHVDHHREAREPIPQRLEVLKREDCRRRQERRPASHPGPL